MHHSGRVRVPVELVVESVDGARWLERWFLGLDDSWYKARYDPARRLPSGRLVGVLCAVVEIMPPISPQQKAVLFTDACRLPMMEDGVFSARLEAAQRREEWAEYLNP